jgi:hypothetical protein
MPFRGLLPQPMTGEYSKSNSSDDDGGELPCRIQLRLACSGLVLSFSFDDRIALVVESRSNACLVDFRQGLYFAETCEAIALAPA